MDLQQIEGQLRYIEQDTPEAVMELIQSSMSQYGENSAEQCLLRAENLAPDNLTVLVALYRFYLKQKRLLDARSVAIRAMAVVSRKLAFPEHWAEVTTSDLVNGIMISFTWVRFYLLALKSAAALNARLGNHAESLSMLNKVIELDNHDRLGAKAILQELESLPQNVCCRST